MDTINWFINNYWNYYLKLEKDFSELLKYVEFNVSNYNTFSFEFLKLYLSICSEIDVVGKVLATQLKKGFVNDSKCNIQKWWYEIQNSLIFNNSLINESEVLFLGGGGYKEVFSPWKNFRIEKYKNKNNSCCYRLEQITKSQTPKWWKNYNEVKHNRTSRKENSYKTNYSNANLYNVVQSLAALYMLEYSYIQKISKTKENFDDSKIFTAAPQIKTTELSLKNSDFIKNFEITNDCFEVLYDAETLDILCFYFIARSKNYYSRLSTFIKINPSFDTLVEIYPRIIVKEEENFDLQKEVKKCIELIKDNAIIENNKSFILKGFFGWNFEKKDSFDGYYYTVDGQLVCRKANGVMNYSYETKKLEKTKIEEWFGDKSEAIYNFLKKHDFDSYLLISKKIEGSYKGQVLMHFENEKMKKFIKNNLKTSEEIKNKIKSLLKI